MAQINLKQLQAFVEVADQRSFRRAAEVLNTTQPNISARIATLEAQLGRRLMARDAGSVRLTQVGEALLPKARAVLRGLDEFLLAAGDDSLFDSTLRLGVTEMIVHSWLASFLSALKSRFPNVEVELTFDYSSALSDALFDRSIDLALQTSPFDRPATGSVGLGSYPFVWVAAQPLSFRDLSGRTILTHARGTLPFDQLQAHLKNTGTAARLVPSTNMSACIQMTLEGLGVTCLPEAMVTRELASGELVRLDYAWRPDPLQFFARYDAEIAPSFVAAAARLARDIASRTRAKE